MRSNQKIAHGLKRLGTPTLSYTWFRSHCARIESIQNRERNQKLLFKRFVTDRNHMIVPSIKN